MTLLIPLTNLTAKAASYSDNYGNTVSYSFNEGEKRLTITGNGEMPYPQYQTPLPWFIYADKVETVEIKSGITAIGTDAFAGFSRLKKIIMASTVTEIGPNAFEGCTSLTNLNIPSHIDIIHSRAFSGCKKSCKYQHF